MNFLRQDAVYLGWFTGQIAIDTGSKTHTLTVNADGDIEIHQLVHSTGVVTTTELDATFDANDHAPGSICELKSGRLLAVWTEVAAGTGIQMNISTNADDSTAWGTQDNIGTATHSYAQLVRVTSEGTGDGRIYLFTRHSGTDPQKTQFYYTDTAVPSVTADWNGPYDLLRCTATDDKPYTVYSTNGTDRIDMATTVVEPPAGRNRTDVYHCYMADLTLYDSSGTSIGDATAGEYTTETTCTQVYDSSGVGNDESWVWDVVTVSTTPSILFATFPNRDTDHDYYIATWDGTDWDDTVKVTDAGGLLTDPANSEEHYSAGVCFDGSDPDAVYASIGTFADGSRLVRMTRSGDTWSEDYTVAGTIGTKVQNFRPIVPYVTSGTVDERCKVIWNHGVYSLQDNYQTSVCYQGDSASMMAAGWSHVLEMDIATGKVTGSAESNGMMAALITHTEFTSTNSTTFWANVKDGGGDIRASIGKTNTGGSEYDAIQCVPVDVYYCDTATEKLKMRVLIPEAAVGGTVQIWFGNSGASARTTLVGTDGDGFPGSEAVWSPEVYAMVPDFTVASGNITDRSVNARTLTVVGTPLYSQTEQYGGVGAMYFTGSDGDMAYADEDFSRASMVLATPDLASTPTEDTEMWFHFNGNTGVSGRYVYAMIEDPTEPSDVRAGTEGGSGTPGNPQDEECLSGFTQVRAVMTGNADTLIRIQVEDRTEQTGNDGSIPTLNSQSINGLRANGPTNIERGKGTYHDLFMYDIGQSIDTDACDTYWANHDDPAAFWDEGTVVAMTATSIPIFMRHYNQLRSA